MVKYVSFRRVLVLLLLCCFAYVDMYADTIIPSHWQKSGSNQLGLSGGKLNYSAPLTGNVCVPPYYYSTNSDYTNRQVDIVTAVCGSSHDGTWVQAREMGSNTTSWYFDGPFLNAVMDTLWLPQTLSIVERGGFENGTAKVIICGATVPPSFDNANKYNYPIYAAKLIVPTGSLSAYKEHAAWGMFGTIKEGAENYLPAQMVKEGSNWYEAYNGKGTLVKGAYVIADKIECGGEKIPVTEMGLAAIDPWANSGVTINSHITNFDIGYHLGTPYFEHYDYLLGYVNASPDNPVYSSIDGILYTKDYKQLLYFFNNWDRDRNRLHIVPIGLESIAEGGIPVYEHSGGTLILPKPITEYCSSKVGCRVEVGDPDFPFIQGDTIRALYSDTGQCFDLHRYSTANVNINIPATLTDHGITHPIKTIGKYSLYLKGHIYDYTDQYGKFYDFKLDYTGPTSSREVFRPFVNAQTAIIPENVEEMYYVFYGATELKSVQLPQTLRIIGSRTFDNCISLTDINFPSQLDSIGNEAFMNCHSLQSINLSTAMKTISYRCFHTCKNLISIVLPQQLNIIGAEAFKNCVKLKQITIPSNVRIIGPYALENCYALSDIYCLGQTPPLVMYPSADPDLIWDVPFKQLFGETRPTPSSCTLHVPKGSLEAYRSAWVWKEFENIVEDAELSIQSPMIQQQPTAHYSVSGVKTNGHHGLNIVRYDDGTMKKVIIK